SLTIAIDVEPSYHALGWNSLPDGAGGPFPARRLSGQEGSWLPRGQKLRNGRFSRYPRRSPVRFRHHIGRDGRGRAFNPSNAGHGEEIPRRAYLVSIAPISGNP